VKFDTPNAKTEARETFLGAYETEKEAKRVRDIIRAIIKVL